MRALSPARTKQDAAPSPGPLVVAGVLLDYAVLRGHRVRALAALNDSKQVEPEERERLLASVVGAAASISVRIVPAGSIDRDGLHRSNLRCLREVLSDLYPPAEACLVDGFRLGPARTPAPRARGRRHEERRDRRCVDRREGRP